MKFKKWIWIFMILLAFFQRSNNIQVFLFEVIIYILIKIFIYKSSGSIKKNDENKLYKYESLNNQDIHDYKLIEEIDWDEIDADVQDAKDSIEKRKKRIESYDFREFKGRKNVDWLEVFDYLWLQCRYKGFSMWNEYLSELVKNGVIQDFEKKLIFRKAGNYIPWNYRMDLDEIDKIKKDEVKKQNDENDAFLRSMKKYNQKLLHSGGMTKEMYDFSVKEKDKSDLYLKSFYYEEYLKRKGYV